MTLDLRTLEPVRVAYMRRTGPFGPGIVDLWSRFAAWCAEQGFMSPRRTTYGVALDDPKVTAPEACRYDACVEVDDDYAAPAGIGIQTLPGGRYACLPFRGKAADAPVAWQQALAAVAASDLAVDRSRPPIEIYGKDFEYDTATGVFTAQLAVPVQA